MMPKPLKIILIAIAIAALIFGIWHYFSDSDQDDSTLTLYGNIDIRQVELTFHDPEHIAEMYVKEGDQVKKGQLLAIQDLDRFQYALESAQAKVEAQRQIVERLIHGSRPEEIKKAEDDVKAAEAEVRFDKKEYDRLKKLVKRHLTSVESVDRARFKLEADRQKLQALKEIYRLAVIGPRTEDISSAKAELKAEESALKLAKKIWEDGHLYAPSEGIIQDRIMEPGDMADYRTPVFTMALIDPVWARVYVPEKRLGQLKYGMPATISTDSYPGKIYQGWVGFISPTAEFTPKTVETPELRTSLVYQIRIFACNANNELRLGMPVTVNIDTLSKKIIKEKSDCPEQS